MNNRLLYFSSLAYLVLSIFLFSACELPNNINENNKTQQVIDPYTKLSYTRHALCRMACRGITEAEIREVLKEGVVNNQKSDPDDAPCPSYAIEDRVADGQYLRIVFARCERSTKVITCIDLEQDFECDCK